METSKKKTVPVIVCAGENGRAVIYGHSDRVPDPGEDVRLNNARMVIRWGNQCGGLFGLASNGPGSDTRLTRVVSETTCTVRQALSVSKDAAKKLDDMESFK